MKIALIDNSEFTEMWSTTAGEANVRYTLPDGSYLSPVVLDWESDDGRFKIVEVVNFTVPEGYVVSGSPSYEYANGKLQETYDVVEAPTPEPVRQTVPKSTVQARLIDLDKMGDAYLILTSNPIFFARWFAPDQPVVYVDDADAIAVLEALELSPEQIEEIMAPDSGQEPA